MAEKFRKESDLIGEREVPESALYGVQTLRGMENFQISRSKMSDYPNFIKGFAMTKMGAAKANAQQGLISKEQEAAILKACQEILDGQHHEHFPTDMIQGGAGTTVNMNANEVIANRALEIMGKKRGEYEFCYPNDVVNCSQSTNDAYPTGIHLGMYMNHLDMMKPLENLIASFEKKAKEFDNVIKMGRTQLQDAVPMTMGQVFRAFAVGLKHEVKNLNRAAEAFLTVNMGATAIGTGICSEPGYSEICVAALKDITKWNIVLAEDLVEATSDCTVFVNYSGAIRSLCVRLNKTCNDLRLMASGPRCGLREINLPALQPGSSIMPGKVNPVIPEVVNQTCFKVMGNDLTVTLAAEAGQLELNVMEPVIAYALFESTELMAHAFDCLRVNCIDGITVNADHCLEMVRNSIGIVTALNPYIGYKNSTKIAKEALETGGSVYNMVIEKGILTKEQLDKILAPEHMIKPTKVQL